MRLKWSGETLAKVIASTTGIGLAGFVQQVYSESRTTTIGTDSTDGNDVGQLRPHPSWIWDFNWDKRDPVFRLHARRSIAGNPKAKLTKEQLFEDIKATTPNPKAARNIFLVRHGQYHDDAECDSERKLTELGRKQAEATGKRLKFFFNSSDRYVVSDMTRALETAEIIRTQLNLKVDPFECDPLLREGSPIEPDPPNRWHPNLHYYTDGVRIEAAFRKFFHRADPCQQKESFEVIVCHANVIRYFCCRALQFPPERWLRLSLGHSSITHVRIDPEGDVSVLSIGDTSHMPKELLTTK